MRFCFLVVLALVFIPVSAESPDAAQSVLKWVDGQMPNLLETYRFLHAHPEISFEEEETAAFVAQVWRDAGYRVTTDIGGYGIVGTLENGDGPVLMLRTDLDALPVTEQTPLPFASKVTTTRPDGGSTGVMHACGHDVHMTNLIGVAQFLAQHRSLWRGTIVLVGQPAEERGAGAKAMLDDGLFLRFPRPDYAVALHVHGDVAAGKIAVLPGYALANVDSVDITVKGRGGHGSAPHTTIDPIVQAAELVVALQMIVSREVKPIEPAVVTVGSIHGGTKHNIIGNDCKLQLTIRSYSDDVRRKVLSAITRKAKAVAAGYGAPGPEVVVSEGTPSLRNDPELTERLRKVFVDAIGKDRVEDDEPSMGGEDFSRYGQAGVPILMYRLGSVSQPRLDRFEKLGIPPPSLHSGVYYPDVEPTLRTGIQTMTAAALELLPPKP